MNNYDELYNELKEIVNEIKPYYDIDKIKYDIVYIWTKGNNGRNVFDITSDKLIFYTKNHKIVEKSKPIIKKIQLKLKEIESKIKKGSDSYNCLYSNMFK